MPARPPCPRARVHPSSQPPPWWTSRGSARVPWWVWGRPGGLWPHPSQPHSRRGGTREDENRPGLHWEGRRRDGLSSRAGSVPGRGTSQSVPRIRQVRPSLLPGRRRAAPPWAAQKQASTSKPPQGSVGADQMTFDLEENTRPAKLCTLLSGQGAPLTPPRPSSMLSPTQGR